MKEKLARLRLLIKELKLEGFILPVNDEFMGEYIPDSAKRLEWLTGFSGSAGLVLITESRAVFFTDGRYTLQASKELTNDYDVVNSAEVSVTMWTDTQLSENSTISYDPKLHTVQTLERYQRSKHIIWKALTHNLIDDLWHNRPAPPAGEVVIQPEHVAGESSRAKRQRITKIMKKNHVDALLLTAPDSICWLLNIRGSDVPYTPFVLAYALLNVDGTLTYYIDERRISNQVRQHLGNDITLHPMSQFQQDCKAYKGKTIAFDPSQTSIWFHEVFVEARAELKEMQDPCQYAKACKNDIEVAGMRAAHVRDGLAVTRFLYWFDTAIRNRNTLSEMDVARKLESFRKQSQQYREPSFTTIAGSGPNGAIVHYRVSPQSNRRLAGDAVFLLDSGAQYQDGTTDITRTVCIGAPTDEMKDRFTRVLKGHIAIATSKFPVGTSGSQLDSFARQYLWQAGADYDHGTGHGVGSYLSVHEGPQRISKRGGDISLAEGMILSNEPGFYKEGSYGIRIESLVVVVKVDSEKGRPFLGFETITLAPIDLRLINRALLTYDEVSWLNHYHARVYEAHIPYLSTQEALWLKDFAL